MYPSRVATDYINRDYKLELDAGDIEKTEKIDFLAFCSGYFHG